MKCFLLSMIMFVSSNQLFAAGAAGAAAAGRPRDMMPMEFIAQMKKFRDEGDLNGGLKLIAQEKDNPKIVHILPIWRGQMATLRGKLEAAGALSVVASNPAGASPAAAGPGSAVGERRLILIKRVPNGSDLEMEINSTATLGDLRREIARRTGISSEKQRLILGGKEVQEDDRTRLQHIPEAFSLNQWHLFEKVPASAAAAAAAPEVKRSLSAVAMESGAALARLDFENAYNDYKTAANAESIQKMQAAIAGLREFDRGDLANAMQGLFDKVVPITPGGPVLARASAGGAGPGGAAGAAGERRLVLIKRVPKGSDLEIEINSTATLGELRREIARRTGISSEKQRLILGGKEVQEDDRTRLQHIPEAFSLNRWHLFEKVPASMTP